MEAFKRTIPDLSPMQAANLIQAFRTKMTSPDANKPVLFEGTRDVLEQLREAGFWLAIATGKGRAGLDQDLEDLNLEELFVATRCSDETQSKPHPQMLNELLEELGMLPEEALVIGDTEYDLCLDSGSQSTILRTDVFEKIPPEERPTIYPFHGKLIGIGGIDQNVRGVARVPFTIDGTTFMVDTLIADIRPCGLLGINFLKENEGSIDFTTGQVTLRGRSFALGQRLNSKIINLVTVSHVRLASNSEIVLEMN